MKLRREVTWETGIRRPKLAEGGFLRGMERGEKSLERDCKDTHL